MIQLQKIQGYRRGKSLISTLYSPVDQTKVPQKQSLELFQLFFKLGHFFMRRILSSWFQFKCIKHTKRYSCWHVRVPIPQVFNTNLYLYLVTSAVNDLSHRLAVAQKFKGQRTISFFGFDDNVWNILFRFFIRSLFLVGRSKDLQERGQIRIANDSIFWILLKARRRLN